MQIRSLTLDELRPAPYNPRIALKPGSPAWRRLERSIREFSLVQPVVWNERTGHVVGGHQRIEVLRHLGHVETECVVVDLPLEREKALNVALNNANLASDWDPDLLVQVLDELQELPDFDATLTGFDESEIRDLRLEPADSFDADEEDEDAVVRVTLEIDPGDWDDVRPELDRLLARHRITPHVRLPEKTGDRIQETGESRERPMRQRRKHRVRSEPANLDP